jgi:hypothetical protein
MPLPALLANPQFLAALAQAGSTLMGGRKGPPAPAPPTAGRGFHFVSPARLGPEPASSQHSVATDFDRSPRWIQASYAGNTGSADARF